VHISSPLSKLARSCIPFSHELKCVCCAAKLHAGA
jgi:hypothetical protein